MAVTDKDGLHRLPGSFDVISQFLGFKAVNPNLLNTRGI
jgi:hypothetical protein